MKPAASKKDSCAKAILKFAVPVACITEPATDSQLVYLGVNVLIFTGHTMKFHNHL